MRDRNRWKRRILRALEDRWPAGGLNVREFCEVELGLHTLARLAPDEPASAVWTLLTGHLFPIEPCRSWSEAEQQMVANARLLLPNFRSARRWRRALQQYRALPENVRGYEVDADLSRFAVRPVSLCAYREAVYTAALGSAVPHDRRPVRWAGSGDYVFTEGGRQAGVTLDPEVIREPPGEYTFNSLGVPERAALEVSRTALLETAEWMDTRERELGLEPGAWHRRLARVELQIVGQEDGRLQASETLRVDRLLHLIGMVSSGKSTLMDVLAVWAARQGMRITLVVGDVIGALHRARLFNALGISAAPVLGASNRTRHTDRLHRADAVEQEGFSLQSVHPGFRWLSTVCALDGLRDTEQPLAPEDRPCLRLRDPAAATPRWPEGEGLACPLYGECPTHQAQRDLPEAAIWIATPASLLHTRVAPQLCPERVRFLELVYRRSDLVIVDEVDQVQVQLDLAFNPSQVLVAPGQDAWLGRLQQRVVDELNRQGRAPLEDPEVEAWCQMHDLAQSAASRIYARLLQCPELKKWVTKSNYFTDWNLLHEIIRELSGAGKEEVEASPDYLRLSGILDEFLDDPLNEQSDTLLSLYAQELLHKRETGPTRERVRQWLRRVKSGAVQLTEEQVETLAGKLELGLLVAVLQNRLAGILRDWRHAELPLRLEDAGALSHTPPRDYGGLVPEPPMGQVLAFQYLKPEGDERAPGTLRFFRCAGVGRSLLLHLPHLFAADGIAGPQVLLLSGTSWAGRAPGYHVPVPVGAVLHAPPAEVAAVAASRFRFLRLEDRQGQPIRVSGQQGEARAAALRQMLDQLTQANGLGGPSQLEQQRDLLPEGRRRVLLLVGSYEEAKKAYDHLQKIRPEWATGIRHLVGDDTQVESHWAGGGDGSSLHRGQVHRFARTGAWLLIAPLLAVERGHNILTEDGRHAALGAAFFLVRPHLRPDDLGYAIHSINRWAGERAAEESWGREAGGNPTLASLGHRFRADAHREWRRLLWLPMRYSTLPHNDRAAVIWTHLVSIWQVIGRLVRGGSPASVFFCDAAFAERAAEFSELPDQPQTSLLVGMREVLRPYCGGASDPLRQDRELVRTLYGPLYDALVRMGGIADGTV